MTARTEPSAATQPASEAELDHLNLSFRATMAAVRRLKGRETQRPGELSFAQFSLLFGLAESAELSSRELACRAELSPATVTQMLDSLEAHGLVKRTRAEHDKRVVLTSLTERGQQLVDERRARYEPRWRAAMSQFDADELRAATAVLDALTVLFNEFADE